MRRLGLAIGFSLLLCATWAHAEDGASCATDANEAAELRRDVQKLTKARAKLRACAAEACPAIVRDECRRQLEDVEANVPSVVLVAEEEGAGTVIEVAVSMDGLPLVAELDGKPIDTDAGLHTFVFRRDGATPLEVRMVLRAGQKNAEVRARFPRKQPALTSVAEQNVGGTIAPTSSPDLGSTPTSSLSTVGLATGGAGLLGLGVGAFFGLRASSLQSESSCHGNVCDPSKGGNPETLKDAQAAGNLSTIFFVAGGALAACGLTLFLIAPKSSAATSARISPVLAPSGAGFTLNGLSF